MKNIALLILTIAAIAFASFYLRQSSKFTEAHTAVEGFQQKVAELQSTVDEQENENVTLRAELHQVQIDSDAKDREIVQLRAAATNPAQRAIASGNPKLQTAPEPSNPFSSLAKMFEELRKTIAAYFPAQLSL